MDTKAEATLRPVARSKRHGFVAGFTVACAELAKTHGEGSLAKMLWVDSGLTLDEARVAGVDPDDLQTIRDALADN